MLRSIRGKNWGASSKLLLTSYKVLIRPIIDYVPFVTLIMAQNNYMILERIQRRAARAITYWPINTSIIYEQLDLEDIHSRALKLTDKYLTRALRGNRLVKDCVNAYKESPKVFEGAFCRSQPRQTIFGTLLNYSELKCYEHLDTD
jgi:hypothetical protein